MKTNFLHTNLSTYIWSPIQMFLSVYSFSSHIKSRPTNHHYENRHSVHTHDFAIIEANQCEFSFLDFAVEPIALFFFSVILNYETLCRLSRLSLYFPSQFMKRITAMERHCYLTFLYTHLSLRETRSWIAASTSSVGSVFHRC